MNKGIHTIHQADNAGLSFFIQSSEFDKIVDGGYELIIIVTPKRRYVASVDDWQDYGYYDLEGDEEILVLNKSYMGA